MNSQGSHEESFWTPPESNAPDEQAAGLSTSIAGNTSDDELGKLDLSAIDPMEDETTEPTTSVLPPRNAFHLSGGHDILSLECEVIDWLRMREKLLDDPFYPLTPTPPLTITLSESTLTQHLMDMKRMRVAIDTFRRMDPMPSVVVKCRDYKKDKSGNLKAMAPCLCFLDVFALFVGRLDFCNLPCGLLNDGYYERFFFEAHSLGTGSFGHVFHCRHLIDGECLGDFAVKKVAVGDDRAWLRKIIREVKAFERLNHPNIVQYKHSWLESWQPNPWCPRVPFLFILMQYCNRGSLQQLIDIWVERNERDRREECKKHSASCIGI
eukprot:g7611.t1